MFEPGTTKLTAKTEQDVNGDVMVTIYDKAHTAREAFNMTRCYFPRGEGRVKLIGRHHNFDDPNAARMIETRIYRQIKD